MLDVSNVYCFRNAHDSSCDSNEEDVDNLLHSVSTRFPLVPYCLVVVNVHEFGDQLTRAIAKLQSDSLVLETGERPVVDLDNSCFASKNEIAKTIRQIEKVMPICHRVI